MLANSAFSDWNLTSPRVLEVSPVPPPNWIQTEIHPDPFLLAFGENTNCAFSGTREEICLNQICVRWLYDQSQDIVHSQRAGA